MSRDAPHCFTWSDRRACDWLIRLGLTPAKSLTLGSVAVPDEYFADFLRGCIDGDGSIVTYVDRYNTFKSPAYVYTRLFVSIVSATPRFVERLRAMIHRLRGLSGSLTVKRAAGSATSGVSDTRSVSPSRSSAGCITGLTSCVSTANAGSRAIS
jgi:hypothetical protein